MFNYKTETNMALKGQITKSDYMEWEEFKSLQLKLERDSEYKFALLIASGCYLGLRIKDLLSLRWSDVLGKEKLILIESKTKKRRVLTIHTELKVIVERLFDKIGSGIDDYLFLNYIKTKVMSVQYLNRKIKSICKKYGVKGRYSTHFMRKTLGRRVYNQNGETEHSLLLLSHLFNHSSVAITKIYLGIREEEIGDLYLAL